MNIAERDIVGHKLHFIVWIRCLACLAVWLVHASNNFTANGFAKFFHIETFDIVFLHTKGAMMGVYMFFLVSGFTMYISLQKYSIKEFLINRFFRIYPVLITGYIIYIICATLYHNTTHTAFPTDWLNIGKSLMDLSLFRDLFPVQWSYLGVIWTLEIEWKFYIFIAFTMFFFRNKPSNVLIFAMVVSIILNILYQYGKHKYDIHAPFTGDMARLYIFQDPTFWQNILTSFPARLWFFAYMLIGSLFAMKFTNKISTKQLVVYVTVCSIVLIPNKTIYYLNIDANPIMSVLLFSAMYRWRNIFKSNAIASFFSNISYPLYLIHPISYFLISVLFKSYHLHWVAIFSITFFVVIAICYAVHKLIEEPFIKLGKLAPSSKSIINP